MDAPYIYYSRVFLDASGSATVSQKIPNGLSFLVRNIKIRNANYTTPIVEVGIISSGYETVKRAIPQDICTISPSISNDGANLESAKLGEIVPWRMCEILGGDQIIFNFSGGVAGDIIDVAVFGRKKGVAE